MATIIGTSGRDFLNGDNDLAGPVSDDSIHGEGGDDQIIGGGGSDNLYGDGGDDSISAGSIAAYAANTYASGGSGGDSIELYSTNATVDGGDGNDAITVHVINDATITGGDGTDNISLYPVGDGASSIDGGSGADTIYVQGLSAGASVTIHGGDDADSIETGNGQDQGTVNAYGDAGDDSMVIKSGYANVYGGDGNDTVHIVSDLGATFDGGAGDDFVEFGYPLSGGTTIITGLAGGDGTDTLQLDVSMTASFAVAWSASQSGFEKLALSGENPDSASIVVTGTGTSLHVDFSGLVVSAADGSLPDYRFAITGTSGNDVVVGPDSVQNQILGGDGNDVLSGGSGNDSIEGDQGNNTLNGGGGDDLLTAGYGDHTADGNNTLNGGAGDDTLYGGAGHDALNGNAGNDTINAEAGGAYTIDGGAGNDSIAVSGGSLISLTGGAGDDDVVLGSVTVNDGALNGGSGTDTLHLQNGVVLAMTDFSAAAIGFEVLGTDRTADTVNGSDIANTLDFSGFTLAVDTNISETETIGVLVDGGGGDDTITGTALNDTISGGDGNDTIDVSGGGSDSANGGDGDDTFLGGAAVDANDYFDGGAGNDVLVLDGNYPTATSLNLTSVETVRLDAGHRYDLNVAATQDALTVDGSALRPHDWLAFDASSTGNLVLTLTGGAGKDSFTFGSNLSAADRIDGGDGFDTVTLAGDYHAGVTFAPGTMTNVEKIVLGTGHNYVLTLDDATVAAGASLTVDGTALGSGDGMTLNGSHETDGQLKLLGGADADTLIGGAGQDQVLGNGGDDKLTLSAGGDDTAKGAGGNDTFVFGAALTAADRIDGGSGYDTVSLGGDYSAGLTFGHATMINVEDLRLGDGYSYNLTTNDATVAAGKTLKVDGSSLGPNATLAFNGSHESDGKFVLLGGAGNDVLKGGAGLDLLTGGQGADVLTGGGGRDHFVYTSVSDSTGMGHDHITDFNAAADKIDLPTTVSGIDTEVTGGALSHANFDADLSAALDDTHLGAGDAVLFAPDAGSYAGHIFLVVDANGEAGYQAGADFVIDVTGAANLDQLSAHDFI